jgi:hypothetical protein
MEWIPGVRSPMVFDATTGAKIGVVYARIPQTAGEEDGALIRIMGSVNTGKRK